MKKTAKINHRTTAITNELLPIKTCDEVFYDKTSKTKCSVLDKNSEEFEMLRNYVKNTHAPTHSDYELEIKDIFKVSRKGEKRRFKPFKTLPNRQLLWHGTRLRNLSGILRKGLKIAPPGAPKVGDMFGKGIYFADMVSKSANYCDASQTNDTGVLFLCEVALGDSMNCVAANFIEQLPKGKNSVKGIGKTYPNPDEAIIRDDGVIVPLGTSVTDLNIEGDLMYNEYVVYDPAQVKLQYMFKMKFNYK